MAESSFKVDKPGVVTYKMTMLTIHTEQCVILPEASSRFALIAEQGILGARLRVWTSMNAPLTTKAGFSVAANNQLCTHHFRSVSRQKKFEKEF